MILAAGRGERMRPLTDSKPKPLQPFLGKPLIQWQVERLAQAGFTDLVINHAWLGNLIEAFVGDGSRFGVRVHWSREGTALGTAGGVALALPWLDAPAFLLVSADIYTEFDYSVLRGQVAALSGPGPVDAHLVLVEDSRHAPDFGLKGGRVETVGQDGLTYGNIGVYRRDFFASLVAGHAAELGPLLRSAVAQGRVTGETYQGRWVNVGTPEDLALGAG